MKLNNDSAMLTRTGVALALVRRFNWARRFALTGCSAWTERWGFKGVQELNWAQGFKGAQELDWVQAL